MPTLIQYVGGKGRQLKELLPLIPNTKLYCEPFGGGGSVLINKSPSEVEVYNDLNENLVALFRVVGSKELSVALQDKLETTLWSRAEFGHALQVLHGDTEPGLVDRAHAMFVVQNMGVSGKLHRTIGNWSRVKEGVSTIDSRWWRRIKWLNDLHLRLQHVQIDCQDALTCLSYWDSPDTTFYIDPPYVWDTRSHQYYDFEYTDEDHSALLDLLMDLEGCVVLSGYQSPLYDPLVEAEWAVHTFGKKVSMEISEEKGNRVEVVWRNPQAATKSVQAPLF
jgi:DNA adenine methylase